MFPWMLAGISIHEILAIVLLVISILTWLFNLIQGNTPNGQARPPRPKAKPQTTRSELENLIQELTTEKRKVKTEQRTESSAAPRPRPERPRPATAPQRPGGPPPYASSRQTTQPAAPTKRMVSDRGGSHLGESIRTHSVGTRIESTFVPVNPPPVPVTIENRTTTTVPMSDKQAHPLAKMLRDPDGIRQALILNEILQPPKSLRR